MAILPDMEKLYAPYSKHANLQDTMKWLAKEAAGKQIPDDIRDAAIMETFLEMAKGKVFPETCDCGCGLTWSCAAMNHYALKKMLEMRDKVIVTATKLIGDRLSVAILEHIQQDNASFEAQYMKPKSVFVDWSKSEVVRTAKWIGSLFQA